MPGPTNQFYRLRIKAADGTTDAITITSVRAGTNPYLLGPPHGDGATYNPLTGESMLGSYTIQVADWPIGGSPVQRVVTSQLEDAKSKQQLAYRRCVLDMGTDGVSFPTVLIVGVLSLIRLVDAMTYEVSIQDPMRAMDQCTMFAPASTMPLATWFSQWPNRGCLAGGPIITPAGSNGLGPLGISDLGGWLMRVEGLQTSGPSSYYILRPRVVYGPPKWIGNTKTKLDDFAEQINNAAAALQTTTFDQTNSAWTTIADAMTHGYCWNGITWLIDAGAGFVAWKPYPFDQYAIVFQDPFEIQYQQSLVSNFSGNWGIAAMPASGQSLTPGAFVRVRAVTVLPTEECPVYLSGHPCDLLKKLWDSVPLAYDQASLDAIKSSGVLGADALITFRITSAIKLSDLVSQIVRPLGIGIRSDTQGRFQLFDGRLGTLNTLPSVTIGAADVIDGTTSLPFELDPSRAVKQITFTQTRFTDQRAAQFNHDDSIVDGVVVGTDELTLINGDDTALPYGTLDWRTDGMLSSKGARAFNWQKYTYGQAQRIFDRFGRGGIAFETTLLRGAAGEGLNLGDEALINLPQIPNHNYRLGDNPAIAARLMQMTRRTVLPEGYAVRFEDSGPALQPLAIVPVLSIAVAADAPRTVAVVTITNASAINSAGYGARLQWAVTTGAAPTSEWIDATAWGPGGVPPDFRFPPVTAGLTVWARARTELAPALPSNYGTPVSVVLSTINPPSGLTVTPVGTDGSLAKLTWTPGSGTANDLTDVWLRASGLPFGQATRLQVLNPGSVQYLIEGLTPGQAYIASVQHRDPRTGDVSAIVDAAFTAAATTRQLAAPVNPYPFAGTVDPRTGVPNRDGTYGIAVLAAEIPGFLEVQIAVETAVGSNAYGAFTTQAVAPAIPSVQGNWTKATFVAPNDGLRRKLQARHVLDGCTPSTYCTPVTVMPWTVLALPPLAANLVIVEMTALAPSPPSDAGVYFRFQVNGIDAGGQTTTVAVTAVSGTSIVSGAAVGVFVPNGSIWKVTLPAPGTGPGSVTVQTMTADGRKASTSFVVPEQGGGLMIPPGIQESTSETPPGSNPMLGTLTITVTDPELRVTQIRFRTQVGNGGWSGYTSFPTTPASISVSLVEEHISKIEYEVWADMNGPSPVLYFRSIVPFSSGSIPMAPSIEASFDGIGNLTVAVIGDSDTQSTRVGVSVFNASTALSNAGAATPVNGRIFVYNNLLLGVGSGVRVYIAAYAYPQTGGGGIASVPTQTAKDREGAGDQTPSGVVTKRQRVSGVMFTPTVETLRYNKAASGVLVGNFNSSGATARFVTAIQLPSGITITAVRANVYLQNASDQMFIYFYQNISGGSATFIAQLTGTGGAGWQTLSGALSVPHTNDDQYTVVAEMTAPVGTAGTTMVAWAEFEYTMPSYDKTI